jgi:hypothetical protein
MPKPCVNTTGPSTERRSNAMRSAGESLASSSSGSCVRVALPPNGTTTPAEALASLSASLLSTRDEEFDSNMSQIWAHYLARQTENKIRRLVAGAYRCFCIRRRNSVVMLELIDGGR